MMSTITELLEHDPFRPFRIVLTSGEKYDVVNPHMLAIGRTELFYAFQRSDRFAFLRMNQIAALETLNGQ